METTQMPASRLVAFLAWGVMLCVSTLPDALWHELAGGAPAWLNRFKIILLLIFAGVALAWKALHPLRDYALILAAVFAGSELVTFVTGSALWQSWFGGAAAPFVRQMFGVQMGRLLIALITIGALLVLRYRRQDFFLTRGQLDAPITPVRWLGFSKPEPWTQFGRNFAIYISLGTLLFLVLGGRPSPAALLQALPLLPAILLFATLNSFNEEMTYRASLLATLENSLGYQHSLWLTAAFFGLGHYFGVPYGVIGVIMATFLGWLMGKAMLETRGFFWAWFIHFLQDVLIFSFMAIGSVAPGG